MRLFEVGVMILEIVTHARLCMLDIVFTYLRHIL